MGFKITNWNSFTRLKSPEVSPTFVQTGDNWWWNTKGYTFSDQPAFGDLILNLSTPRPGPRLLWTHPGLEDTKVKEVNISFTVTGLSLRTEICLRLLSTWQNLFLQVAMFLTVFYNPRRGRGNSWDTNDMTCETVLYCTMGGGLFFPIEDCVTGDNALCSFSPNSSFYVLFRFHSILLI